MGEEILLLSPLSLRVTHSKQVNQLAYLGARQVHQLVKEDSRLRLFSEQQLGRQIQVRAARALYLMRLKNQRDKAYLEVKVQQDSNQLKIHRLLLYLALQNQLEDPYLVDPNLLPVISSLLLLVNHYLDNLTKPNSNQILLKISNFKTNLSSPWTCL